MEFIKNFEQNFDGRRLKDGKEYYKEGLVKNVVLVDNTVSAIVEGNRAYKVKINLNNRLLSCTCPCDFNCKHLVALCYFLRSNKVGQADKVMKNLNKKSKKELLKLVKKLILYNPDSLTFIDEDTSNIEKQIKQLWIKYEDELSYFYNKFEHILRLFKMKDDRKKVLFLLLDRLIDLSDHSWNDEGELDCCFEEVFCLVNEELKKMDEKEAKKIKKDIEYRLSNFDYLLDLLD